MSTPLQFSGKKRSNTATPFILIVVLKETAMFEGYLGWLSEIDAKVSFFVVPLAPVDSSFDWSSLISTVVGGGVTLIASLVVFYISNRAEKGRREQERNVISANNARTGFIKLIRWANLVANIDKHLNNFFDEAKEERHWSEEAYRIVGPSAGTFTMPERLKAEEYSFLLSEEHSELLSEIQMVEERAININHLFEKYSTEFKEYNDWLHGLPGMHRELSGPIAKTEIPIAYKSQEDERGAQLNRLLAGIMEHLDDDMASAAEAATEFGKIAYEKFKPQIGEHGFKLEKKTPSKTTIEQAINRVNAHHAFEVPVFSSASATFNTTD